MLLGTLGASLLENLLTGKGILRAGSGRPLSSTWKNKKGKEILRADSGNKKWKGILRAGSGNKKWKGILRAGSGHCLFPNPKENGIFNATSSCNKFWNAKTF